MKHTPGPWKVMNSYPLDVATAAVNEQGFPQLVAVAHPWMDRSGDAERNARLIAKAPELLELLKLWHEHRDWHPVEDILDMQERTAKLIKEIEGDDD